MDNFRFTRTKSGRSFLQVEGPARSVLIDVEEIGRMWGMDGKTSIVIRSGSSEVINAEAAKLIEAFLSFLDGK